MLSFLGSAAVLAATTFVASPAQAQEAQFAGLFDVMGGIEGGGSGYAKGIRRTRTTLRFGAEMWLDEYENNQLAIAGLVEIEPVATFGADIRYQRVIDDFVLHVGGTSIIAPQHMIGATFGAAYRLGVTDIFDLNFGPNGNVYFVGADLPGDTVLWQVMLAAGARVSL